MSSRYSHRARDVFLIKGKKEEAEEKEESEKKVKTCAIDKDNQKITKVNNHIYFYSEVTRNSIFALTTLIREVEQDNMALANTLCIDPIPIYLHISSFGGSVFAAFTAIDVILACQVAPHGRSCVWFNWILSRMFKSGSYLFRTPNVSFI